MKNPFLRVALATVLFCFCPIFAFAADKQPISAGRPQSLAVKPDGTVWAWGKNAGGQLGTGLTDPQLNQPRQVVNLTGIVSVAAGDDHQLALKNDGTVWSWGGNNYGQLGTGTTFNQPLPAQIAGLSGVVAISARGFHSMALKSDGTVCQWGNCYVVNLPAPTLVPTFIPGLTGVRSIADGYTHSLALKNDGTVWAWGVNGFGQLGDGGTQSRLAPLPVSGLTSVIGIAAGWFHSMALRADGTLWTWGFNGYGQLGDGSTQNRLAPVPVTGWTGVVGLSAGGYHSLALLSNGKMTAWGYNGNGELGDGTTANRATPVTVPSVSGVVTMAAGYDHTLAMLSDGRLLAWGANYSGQLGDGTSTNRNTPVNVSGFSAGPNPFYQNAFVGNVTATGSLQIGTDLAVGGNADFAGNAFSLGTRTDNQPGFSVNYTDGASSSIIFGATRTSNSWAWKNDIGGTPASQMTLSAGNVLSLYSALGAAEIVLDPAVPKLTIGSGATPVARPGTKLHVKGPVRIDGPVRIEPQGDISMGGFTVEPQ